MTRCFPLTLDLMTNNTQLPSNLNNLLKQMTKRKHINTYLQHTFDLMTKKTKLPSDFNNILKRMTQKPNDKMFSTYTWSNDQQKQFLSDLNNFLKGMAQNTE